MTIWRWQTLENTSSKLILTHHDIPGASFSSFQKSFLAGTNAVLKILSEQGVTRPLFFNFFTTKWNIFRRSMLYFMHLCFHKIFFSGFSEHSQSYNVISEGSCWLQSFILARQTFYRFCCNTYLFPWGL